MKLTDISVKKPTTIIALYIAVLIFGIAAFIRLPIDLLPKIDPPAISVYTIYKGASASDVETNVTKYIEDYLSSVSNLDKISSVSKDNISIVTCILKWGTDLNEASNNIRDKLGFATADLPKDIEQPVLLKFNSAMFPIMIATMSAEESYPNLYYLADKIVGDELRRSKGVATVYIDGGLKRQININFDKEKISKYNLSVQQITQTLALENINVPVGNIKIGTFDYQIRIPGKFKSLSEINNVIVGSNKNAYIYLKDVAVVSDGFKENISSIWGNYKKSVIVLIQKQSGANTLEVCNEIKSKLIKLKQRLPADVDYTIAIDTSNDINSFINNLSSTVKIGAVLVIIITFLFLRHLLPSLIIVIVIPVSLIITSIFLYLFDISINIISLMSIAIVVGMVVDNAIVVLENVYRHISDGEDPIEAARYGTDEISMSIFASSFTTIVIFAPLIFVKGIAGILFKDLAIVTIVTISISLLVSLTLTPLLCSRFLKPLTNRTIKNRLINFLFNQSEMFFLFLDNSYKKLIEFHLKHRIKTLFVFVLIFIGIIILSVFIGSDFLPKVDNGELSITVELKEGTRLEETTKTASKIMDIFKENVPEAENIYVVSGQSERGLFSVFGFKEGSNIIIAGAKLIPKEERKRSNEKIANIIRPLFKQIPEIKNITVSSAGLVQKIFAGSGSKPVSLEILGSDYKENKKIAQQLIKKMKKIRGLTDISMSLGNLRPTLSIKINRDKAAKLGLNMAMIADTLRTHIYGLTITKYRDYGEDYDIFLRLNAESRLKTDDIYNISIRSLNGNLIQLSSIAVIEYTYTPIELERKQRRRLVRVEADIVGFSLGDAKRKIDSIIKQINYPSDIIIQWGGEVEEQKKAFVDLLQLLILGIILVYLVMVAQFESFLLPFIIMFSIPFTFIGVVLAFLITGTTLNIFSFLGIIMLMGIVVNNAIVLIDYMNILRERKYLLNNAIVLAGQHRLRPILITTLTTIFGMLPMALSKSTGSEIWNTLGITVIGGLSVSTIVTLILIPVIYSIMTQKRKVV